MNWYVVRAISGKERKAKEYLDIEIGRLKMSLIIPQVVVPTERVVQIRNGKKTIKEKNILPGYMLVETNLEGESQFVIKSTPNIIGFVDVDKDGKPTPIRENEVNRMLGKSDETIDLDDQLLINFRVGESIKVVDGPFNNFDGVIEEVNEEKKKLKVMIKIFGRKTPVELNYMQVEKQ
jgi:transcriptional antiterminator NusG